MEEKLLLLNRIKMKSNVVKQAEEEVKNFNIEYIGNYAILCEKFIGGLNNELNFELGLKEEEQIDVKTLIEHLENKLENIIKKDFYFDGTNLHYLTRDIIKCLRLVLLYYEKIKDLSVDAMLIILKKYEGAAVPKKEQIEGKLIVFDDKLEKELITYANSLPDLKRENPRSLNMLLIKFLNIKLKRKLSDEEKKRLKSIKEKLK